jgi:hypothetical protein
MDFLRVLSDARERFYHRGSLFPFPFPFFLMPQSLRMPGEAALEYG